MESVTKPNTVNHQTQPRSRLKRNIRTLHLVLLMLGGFAFPFTNLYANNGNEKKEDQSVFVTAYPEERKISSTAFIKLLNAKLDGKYQDLEIVITSCHSGDFVIRANDAENGLKGEWSVSTACNFKNTGGERFKDTRGKREISKIKVSGQLYLRGWDTGYGRYCVSGLKIGEKYYYGYWAQYLKKLIEDSGSTNKILHDTAAQNLLEKNTATPQYKSSTEFADNMTLNGNASTMSKHAILFVQAHDTPQKKEAKETLALRHYDALKDLPPKGQPPQPYNDDDIDLLLDTRKGDSDPKFLNVDRNANYQDLVNALDAMRTKLDQNEYKEKAYIAIVGTHGGWAPLTVAYAGSEKSMGFPGDGRMLTYPSGYVDVDTESNFLECLMEEVPSSGGGFWQDDPDVERGCPPFICYGTSSENFAGPPVVNIYLNSHFLTQDTLNGSPSGGDYSISIPDDVLDMIFPEAQADSFLSVGFEFVAPGDSIRLATDSDFYADSTASRLYYGVSLGFAIHSCDVSTDVPVLTSWSIVILVLLLMACAIIVLIRRKALFSNRTK